MIIYSFGMIVSIIFSYMACKNNNKKSESFRILSFLSAVPLTVISGLRYNVGADYKGYTNFFYYMLYNPNSKIIGNFEIGFKLMTKLIQSVTSNPIWLFITISIIISFFVFKAIYNESPNPPLSIFLYVSMQFYFYSMNGMRQFIAMSIFMFSIKYIKNRKIIPFLLLNLIGVTFHSSSILFIPLYFLYNIKLTPKVSVLLLFICTIFANYIYKYLLMIVLNTKYATYIGSKYDTGTHGYIVMFIQIFILIFALFWYRKREKNKENKSYNFYCILQLFATYFSCIDGLLPLLSRLRISFSLPSIILIPMSLELIKNKKERFLFQTCIILLFSSYIIYTIGFQNANSVLPYTTIFN